jgi:hypothetical protein
MDTRYPIEQLLTDHPGLWSDGFRVCAVARCREFGKPPWPLNITCEELPNAPAGDVRVEILWTEDTERDSRKAMATFQPNRLTEDAAIGLGGAAFAALGEGHITEVTQHGDGVDYWIDDRRAALEVSGLRSGGEAELTQRRREKLKQLVSSTLADIGVPGYVFVVLFSQGKATLDYRHTESRQQ